MSHPETYIAYGFTEKSGQLQRLIMPWKDPGENQVTIKVLACAAAAEDEAARRQEGHLRIPGHEIVGDLVGAGWHGGHCSTCNACRSGDFFMCPKRPITGITVDGGYAEYATLRVESLVRIPEGMDSVEASPIMCAGTTVYGGLLNAGLKPGDIVGIQGIDALGHLAIQFASKLNFLPIALSSSSSKRSTSLSLGAITHLDSSQTSQTSELQTLGGAKATIACAPDAEAIGSLVRGLDPDGVLVVVGAA